MDIRIFGITDDSVVDGPGMRLSVFVQGCSHRCEGCHNPASHDPAGGSVLRTGDILQRLRANPLESGITLSGGEPMEQAEACRELAEGARALGKNVWTYTGYTWERLLEEGDPARMALLAATDVLIDGPFRQAERSLELAFRGSRNQRVIDVHASLDARQVILYVPAPWVEY